MVYMILRLFCAGVLCVCLCKAQSTKCAALKTCARHFGQSISVPSIRDPYTHLSPKEIITRIYDSMCKNKNLLMKCYSGFKHCDVYDGPLRNIKSTDLKQGIDLLCGHKQDFISATICAVNVVQNTESDGLHNSQECLTKMRELQHMSNRASGFCSSLNKVIDCSQLMKETYTCLSPLMILQQENGIETPCIRTFKVLSKNRHSHQLSSTGNLYFNLQSSARSLHSKLLYYVFVGVLIVMLLK